MIRLVYHVLVWPFRLLVGALLDDVLVRLGLKFYPAIGSALPRASARRRR